MRSITAVTSGSRAVRGVDGEGAAVVDGEGAAVVNGEGTAVVDGEGAAVVGGNGWQGVVKRGAGNGAVDVR